MELQLLSLNDYIHGLGKTKHFKDNNGNFTLHVVSMKLLIVEKEKEVDPRSYMSLRYKVIAFIDQGMLVHLHEPIYVDLVPADIVGGYTLTETDTEWLLSKMNG